MNCLDSLYDALVSIQFPSDKARAVVDARERDMTTALATKQDLAEMRNHGDAQYALLRQEVETLRVSVTTGHEVALVDDGPSVLTAIQDREPDLVVLDHAMPGMKGFEVCRRIKQNPFTARIPVLMLTAQSTVESKVEGFAAGADDYLAKPFDPRELRARVQALLRLVQRESDRNPTSGLPGGRAIDREIMQRINRGESFAVCYLDLDFFKPFADTFGFAVADEVIRGLGSAIRESAGTVGGNDGRDFVGHIGGAHSQLREVDPGVRAHEEHRGGDARERESSHVPVSIQTREAPHPPGWGRLRPACYRMAMQRVQTRPRNRSQK